MSDNSKIEWPAFTWGFITGLVIALIIIVVVAFAVCINSNPPDLLAREWPR